MSETNTEDKKEAPKARQRKYRRPPRHRRPSSKKNLQSDGQSEQVAAAAAGREEKKPTAVPPPPRRDLPEEAMKTPSEAVEKPKGIRSAISRLLNNAFGPKDGESTAPAAVSEAKKPEPAANATPPEALAAPVNASAAPPEEKESLTEPKTPGRGKSRRPNRQKRPTEKKQQPAAGQAAPSAVLKLLINTEEPEECRLALVENGKVEAFHIETISREKTKGNIYKGKIVAIEPSLHAVFVDIGLEKNAFLPFGEIHPEYYSKEVESDTHWKDLNITEMVSKGQEVLVEIVKEAAGTKGANVTTYLSLPGRYLVLMPGSDSQGISRKLGDEDRNALKEMIKSFNLPEGIGYIIRTASKDVTKAALSKDVRYLLNLWKTIKGRGQKQAAPSLVFREQNIIARYLRDHFSPEISEIIVDSQEAFDQVQNFLTLIPARQKATTVRLHKASRPLFSHFNVEEQIEQVYHPKVKLPSGGSIVINPTEALVAIDVNSGRTSKDKNFEESIFLANMEAAEELARQLRLRDLGGLIVVDFIDMRLAKHVREVEKQVKTSMKRDKAKFDLSRISKFGLMQISRQRLGPPVQAESYRICERCQGRGMVRSVETQVLAFLRKIQIGVGRRNVKNVVCTFPMDIAAYLLNKKRADLVELEEKYKVSIQVTAVPGLNPSESQIEFQSEE